MRKTKEEKVLEKSQLQLDELQKIYVNGLAVDAYEKLSTEYRRLYKRHEKIIKQSDNMGSEILEQKETLDENLQYTLKTARTKLMDNVVEHRKTKEQVTSYKKMILQLERALQHTNLENISLKNKLNQYQKKYGVSHVFEEKQALLFDDMSSYFKQLFSWETEGTIVIKLVLKDAVLIQNELKQHNIEEQSFFLSLKEHVQHTYGKEALICYASLDTFYVSHLGKDKHYFQKAFEQLNKKRKLFSYKIHFDMANDLLDNNKSLDANIQWYKALT